MVQLIVSQSCCSKAAKIFGKSTIFKHNSFTQHALCCRARDVEFWEAVGRVPFDQGGKRPISALIRLAKIPKTWTGIFCWMESAQCLRMIPIPAPQRNGTLWQPFFPNQSCAKEVDDVTDRMGREGKMRDPGNEVGEGIFQPRSQGPLSR